MLVLLLFVSSSLAAPRDSAYDCGDVRVWVRECVEEARAGAREDMLMAKRPEDYQVSSL